MTVVSFEELMPQCDDDAACEFLFELHKYSPGWVVISRIRDTPHTVNSFAGELATVLRDFSRCIAEIVGEYWQVYTSVATHDRDPCDGGGYRGGIDSVLAVPGVWADLDVGPGKFPSTQAIDHFLAALPESSIQVATGSGGYHCYWLWNHAPLDRRSGGQLSRAWYHWLQERAPEGVNIDRVYPVDRILRVPGTIRWPKIGKGETGPGRPVRTVSLRGPRYTWEQVQAWSWEAYRRAEEAAARGRADQARNEVSAGARLRELRSGGNDDWLPLQRLGLLTDWLNENTSWAQILEPVGWTKVLDEEGRHKHDGEGRYFWARPGQSNKSATVDWPASPHTMALKSLAPETGLLRLVDLNLDPEYRIKLTKSRVITELWYAGDAERLVEETLKRMERQGD